MYRERSFPGASEKAAAEGAAAEFIRRFRPTEQRCDFPEGGELGLDAEGPRATRGVEA